MELNQVIIKPIITEKSLKGHPFGQYSFKVHPQANKTLVAKAADSLFGVKAVRVNISIVKPSTKVNNRRRKISVPGYKKAVILVASGQTISIFEEPKADKKLKKSSKK